MKNLLFYLFFFLLSINSFAQITFENGYFINEFGEKTLCLIKNIDWKNNPVEFSYKLNENSPIYKEDINNIKEFGITGFSKYIRASVNIDRSSNNMQELSTERNPIFNNEVLFLKVLIEGDYSLYLYQDNNLTRFFYKTNNANISQLVYKRYIKKYNPSDYDKYAVDVEVEKLATNNYFQQQLIIISQNHNISKSKIEHLTYNQKSLKRFFKDLNGKNFSETEIKKEHHRNLFHLNLRPGLNFSNLTISNNYSLYGPYNFDSNQSLRFGLETEFILPFNKNKWSIIFEPTYQSFNKNCTIETEYVSGGVINANADYKSIELPLGVRHYFFLSNNTSIFINASIIYDCCINSSITFSRKDETTIDKLNLNSRLNTGFGAGFKLKNKYGLEFRYQTNRHILSDYLTYKSKYSSTSIILSYTLF